MQKYESFGDNQKKISIFALFKPKRKVNEANNHSETVFNTGETAESLRREYNPDGSLLREAQLRLLDMLDYIDKVCREQGISYRLDSGNVIGALRHGGFIPWDDDVDVALSWSDYKRLCQYLSSHPHPRYKLQSPETDKDYLYTWNKLRDVKSQYVMNYPEGSKDMKVFERQKYKGLQIDLFPFEDHMLPQLQRLAGKLACVAAFDIGQDYPRLGRFLFNLNRRVFFPLFRLAGKFIGKADVVQHSYGTWFYKRYRKQDIVPYAKADFEGHSYPVPADADAFCRTIYGDYWQLPPKEKREWHAADIIYFD